MAKRVLHLQGKAFTVSVLYSTIFFRERTKGTAAFITKYKLCSALTGA